MPYEYAHAIVFTGHRIDAPGRPKPRFPASAEAQVRHAIRAALIEIQTQHQSQPPGSAVEGDGTATDTAAADIIGSSSIAGIAGGACGGDLIFHEVCDELGVGTRLVLALPGPAFLAASVEDGGPHWVERFQTLTARLGPNGTPWIAATPPDTPWAVANRTMLDLSIQLAPRQTLLALWDGRVGDGPGGTSAMIAMAAQRGIPNITLTMQSMLRPA